MELVRIDNSGSRWLQMKQIIKLFSLSRTTAYRLLLEMRAMKKYQKSFIDVSSRLKLVRESDFIDFMQSRQQA